MYHTHISNQEFNTNKTSLLRDTAKIGKKSTVLKTSRTSTLHDNNAKKNLIIK